MTDARPLSHLRVVELSTGLAGAYATKLFADAGADVIKVEPPGGDPLRRWSASGPPPGGADGALFRYLSSSKRSVTAGPGSPEVGRLVADADIAVVNAVPDGLLSDPDLVVLSITPFGTGNAWSERPATEFTIQAESGSISQRGRPDGPPVQAGGRIAEWAAGVFGASTALAAAHHARRGGGGTHVDVSMTEVMCLCTNLFVDLMWSLLGRPPMPQPARSVEFPSVEPTSDGFVGFNTNAQQMFEDFLVMVERSDVAHVPGVRSDASRRPELEASVRAWTSARTTEEIVDLASLFRIPVAPIGNGDNLPAHPHLAARDAFTTHPTEGFVHPRPPYRIDGRPLPPAGPPPAAGEHTGRIEARPRPAGGTGAGRLPFDRVKVLDITCWWAGPAVTQLFAALGADVIHVESVQRIDGMRPAGTIPFAGRDRWWEYSSFFLDINVNKRGLTLNLDDPRGLELASRLIGWADLVVENYTPRVMDNFGLGWDTVHRINPRAVMVRMPAFGLDGPWRDRVGFAQTMEEMSGMAWVTGFVDGPPVLPRGPCDPLGGMHAAFAAQVALAQRDATGEGVLVEAALIDSALNLAAEQVVERSATGHLIERQGNRSVGAAPQGLYACAGQEQWLALSVVDDAQWLGLCAALGRPAWATTPDLAGHAGRLAVADDIDAELAAWAATRALDDTVELLVAHGVPAAAVVDYRSVSSHPQMSARGFFEDCDHPVVGRHRMFGLPLRYRGVERWIRTPAPTLGQHNTEILRDILGLDDAAIAELRDAAVIGDRPLGL